MFHKWKNMIKPKELLIDYISLSQSYGKFIVEPLEKGYGVTLGNALRRILLSSLFGHAITSLSIKNIKHEYSSIIGVKEDIADVILNLKLVQVALLNDVEHITARISKQGPSIVRAADIHGDNMKIFNNDLYICTISSNSKLDILITIEVGKGFVTANQNKLDLKQKEKTGIIWINTNFSPIKKVNYNILNARIGQKTDYDKLILEIWTNNSINPEKSIETAAKILREQALIFINLPESVENQTLKLPKKNNTKINENLFKQISELELSVRASNCLNSAKINNMIELVQKTETDMLKTKNFGRKSLKEVKDVLHKMGLSLNMNLKNVSIINKKKI